MKTNDSLWSRKEFENMKGTDKNDQERQSFNSLGFTGTLPT
jgi:hypothetical protein